MASDWVCKCEHILLNVLKSSKPTCMPENVFRFSAVWTQAKSSHAHLISLYSTNISFIFPSSQLSNTNTYSVLANTLPGTYSTRTASESGTWKLITQPSQLREHSRILNNSSVVSLGRHKHTHPTYSKWASTYYLPSPPRFPAFVSHLFLQKGTETQTVATWN